MSPTLVLKVLGGDNDYFEMEFYASNERIAATIEYYASPTAHLELAEVLRGFPASPSDRREVVLGTLTPGYAGGGIRLQLGCLNSRGYCFADIFAQSQNENAAFKLGFLPAALDRFVFDLEHLPQLKRVELNDAISV